MRRPWAGDAVTDLERLFRQIVHTLAVTDPARLHQPLPLAEIRDSIVPYRANRRVLQLESSEEYELALMRLGAGEGGFAHTEPAEARTQFASELRSPNPDLTVVQRHEKAVMSLNPQALAKAMNQEPDRSFAPPEPVPTPTKQTPKPVKSAPAPVASDSPIPQCSRCGSQLPAGRKVNYCPQCGHNLARPRCPQCNSEMEPSWRHCVSCGHSLRKPPS